MHAGAFYSRTQVRLEGPAKIFTRRGDSGGEVHCHFCPECGSTVAWFADKLPDRVGIAIGCFADPEFPAPTLSVWEEAMHEWVGLPTGVSRWKQTPTL